MKRIIVNGFSVLILSALCVCTALAQQVRVALKDNAYVIKEGKYVALEVDGKIVIDFDNEFIQIITSTGKYFAAEDEEGDFMLFDRTGKEVELGGGSFGSFFDKVSMIDGTIVIQTKGKTHYFSESDLSVEIQAQQADPNIFEKELEEKGGFSPLLTGQRKDVEIMKRELAGVDPIGWFELKPNQTKGVDLIVDGKVLFNARSFTLISTAEEYKKSNCWFFIVTRGDYYQSYGVYGISMWMEDGKKSVENILTIPYEYTFISHEGGNMVKCSKNTGSSYFNWWGWKFIINQGKFEPTYEKWIHNKSTDKWTLLKQDIQK